MWTRLGSLYIKPNWPMLPSPVATCIVTFDGARIVEYSVYGLKAVHIVPAKFSREVFI